MSMACQDTWAHVILSLQLTSENIHCLTKSVHGRGFYVGVAALVSLVAVSLSAFLVWRHLTAYSKPEEQKWVIGILLMVPIYSIVSLLSLWAPSSSVLCVLLREGYEAYTIYCFGRYLIACLGGEDKVIEKLRVQASQPSIHTPLLHRELGRHAASPLRRPVRTGEVAHPFILSWIFSPWVMGPHFYKGVKFGIVQYMIVKVVGAVLTLILEAWGVYNDGDFSLESGYLYISLAINFSQFWALYCLFQFFSAMHEFLFPIRPWPKFLCIKAVIFLTWWQGFLVAALFGFKLLHPPAGTTSDKFQGDVQNFLICMEMALAALAHYSAFPSTPYEQLENNFSSRTEILSTFADPNAPADPVERMESERPALMKNREVRREAVTLPSLSQSLQDVICVGTALVVDDLKSTVTDVTDPVQRTVDRWRGNVQGGMDKLGALAGAWGRGRTSPSSAHGDTLHTQTDTEGGRVGPVRGIDESFLERGSLSDSAYVVPRGRGKGVVSEITPSHVGESSSAMGGGRWHSRGRSSGSFSGSGKIEHLR